MRSSLLASHLRISPGINHRNGQETGRRRTCLSQLRFGICLTEEGERQALQLVRKHRLAERFLTDVLGISWDKAHEEACKFEHVLDEEVEDGLDRLLSSPATCPHGHPIPSKQGVVKHQPSKRLCELGAGDKCVIVLISEEEPEMLRYLASLGLFPQATF